MKKDKICSCTISMDIFDSTIVVMMTTSKDYLYKEVENVLTEDLGMKENYAKEYSINLRKFLDEEEILPPGLVLDIDTASGINTVFVILRGTPKTVANETIIHEMVHAMQCTCDFMGIKDRETEAYMVEYLCHKLFERIAEWNKGTKKG